MLVEFAEGLVAASLHAHQLAEFLKIPAMSGLLDDHLAFFQGRFGSKRYFRYSERAWRILIGNSVQYINRLTSSQIIGLLTDAGFSIDSIETDSSGDTAPGEVHPDYRNQSEADIRAVRLNGQAAKR